MENAFANRLQSARKMAGLSLQSLADKLGNVVTKQALNKYEQGKMKPDSTGLIALANALQVPVDYFYANPSVIQLTQIDFRKYSTKISNTLEESIKEKVKYQCERYFELEDLLALDEKSDYFIYSGIVKDEQDAEEAAKALRKQWNLGEDPIPDVVELLEDKGYKVVEINSPDGFDGMKANAGDRKVIALPKLEGEDIDIVRRRFTALHELAHHALTFAEDLLEKFIERLCHVFASAVLYPAEKALKELHHSRFHFYVNELVLLKERWGISFPAIMQRAARLGIVDKNLITRFSIAYNKRGYRKNEPGRFSSKEKPNRLERLVYLALAKEVISLNEAAYFMDTTAWKIRANMNLMV